MNRILASTLSALNLIYALLIILAGMGIGSTMAVQGGAPSGIGMILGAVVGILVASIVCGLVAFLTLIERHLSHLADCADYQNKLMKMDAERR